MTDIARTFSLSTKVCSNNCLSTSDNCEVAVAAENSIQIMDFTQDPLHDAGQFNFTATRIPPHKDIYRPDVGISREAALKCYSVLKNEDSVNILHDRTLCRGSPSLLGYKLVRWSPRGMDKVKRCVLLALSLDHRLSVYSRGQSENTWTEVISLSDILFDYMKSLNFEVIKMEGKKNNAVLYKNRMYSISVIEFAWSPHLYSKTGSDDGSNIVEYSRLVTATKAGHVIFWTLDSPVSASSVQVERVIQLPQCSIVSALHWCTDQTNPGYLVLGCVNGKIYKINLQDYSATELWTENDDIRVTHIIWLSKLDIIVASKGTYIIMLKLSGDLPLQSAGVKCVFNKLPITGLVSCADDKICLCSGNGVVQIGQISIIDTVPSVELCELLIQRQSTRPIANHGLTVSPNHMFIAIAESPTKVLNRLPTKDPLKIHIINISMPSDVTNILFDSTLTSLQGLCDVFGSSKFHLNQLQPEFEQFFEQMRSGIWHKSLTQLKVLRFLLRLKLHQNFAEPEPEMKTFLENVTVVISKKHLIGLLKELVDKVLTKTEQRIVCLSRFLLRQFDDNASEVKELLETMDRCISSINQPIYPESCPICRSAFTDCTLVAACCPRGHALSRCPQTLLLCHRVPYRRCGWCRTLYVHKLQEPDSSWLPKAQNDFCVFCDQSLHYCM